MRSNIRLLKDVLWILAMFGLMSGIFRMWFGLGATTNMVDEIPWGLWKILNMVAGAALATSGFTIGILYYVFKRNEFKPLVIPAVVVAFLGYGSSLFSLLFDIGLPWRFWIPFTSWNPHSFLYEVFWCVSLYWLVTAFELTPSIFERLKSVKVAHLLHSLGFATAILGITLSSLHHSSLGSLFLVTPKRLHPLWYSSLLPVFFIISAMGAGIMFLILVRLLYARYYDPEPVFGQRVEQSLISCSVNGEVSNIRKPGTDIPVLSNLALISAGILSVYLLLKVIDLFDNGSWQNLLNWTWESWLYLFELAISTVIPISLLLIKRVRKTPKGLGVVAFLAVAGLVINRLDVGIIGYFRNAGTIYSPSLLEWTLSLGVIAATLLTFLFIAENLSIFDDSWKSRSLLNGLFSGSFDSLSHVWKTVLSDSAQRVTLIAVVVIPIAWISQYPPYHEADELTNAVLPSLGVDEERNVLHIDGNRSGVFTEFPHADHQQRFGGKESCQKCHHITMPEDMSTPCSRCHKDMFNSTSIFNHEYHTVAVADSEGIGGWHPTNHTCSICHLDSRVKTAENAKSCQKCHERDMRLGEEELNDAFMYASSYQRAMHGTCVKCHEEKSKELGKPELGMCFTCHTSLKPNERAVQELKMRNIQLVVASVCTRTESD